MFSFLYVLHMNPPSSSYSLQRSIHGIYVTLSLLRRIDSKKKKTPDDELSRPQHHYYSQ